MKICTFNVNSIRMRKDLIIEWIKHREDDLDVLCFQELKAVEDLFPLTDFEQMGFHCEVFGQKGYNGVAICAKQPLGSVQKGFVGDPTEEQKRFISGQIEGIHLINIYAPHGGLEGEEKFQYKQDWYHKLMAHLNDHYSPEDPLVIVGDFNVAREDADVYDPIGLKDSIGTLPSERALFEELMSWGFVDAFKHKHPDMRQFTWWDYIGGAIWKDEGMRIDYALCTQTLVESVENVEVDLWPRRRRQPKPSDHAPLIITLNLSI
ncbi:exodeoxyribonuclease III [Acidobacteriota bacterium]